MKINEGILSKTFQSKELQNFDLVLNDLFKIDEIFLDITGGPRKRNSDGTLKPKSKEPRTLDTMLAKLESKNIDISQFPYVSDAYRNTIITNINNEYEQIYDSLLMFYGYMKESLLGRGHFIREYDGKRENSTSKKFKGFKFAKEGVVGNNNSLFSNMNIRLKESLSRKVKDKYILLLQLIEKGEFKDSNYSYKYMYPIKREEKEGNIYPHDVAAFQGILNDNHFSFMDGNLINTDKVYESLLNISDWIKLGGAIGFWDYMKGEKINKNNKIWTPLEGVNIDCHLDYKEFTSHKKTGYEGIAHVIKLPTNHIVEVQLVSKTMNYANEKLGETERNKYIAGKIVKNNKNYPMFIDNEADDLLRIRD